jgi:protein-glutamine gamma-glutamyltransferase
MTTARARLFAPARLDRAFDLSLLLTVATAHAALVSTGEMKPLHLVIMIGSLAAIVLWGPRLAAWPARVWDLAALAAFGASLWTALTPPRGFDSYYYGATYLLVSVIAFRWFSRRTGRDDLVILLLALLELCATSIATISVSFLALIVLFAAAAVSVMMLGAVKLELAAADRHEAAQLGPAGAAGATASAPGRPRRVLVNPRIFLFALGSTGAIMVLAIGIFFIIPRVGRGMFTWRAGNSPRVAGFSDTVEMGSMGKLKQGRSLVMRVSLPDGQAPMELYLRGAALDHYDGRSWKDTLGLVPSPYIYFRFNEAVKLAPVKGLRNTLRQDIILEPTDSPIIFGAPFLKSALVPFRFRAVLALRNDYYRFPLDVPQFDRVSYSAWSSAPPAEPRYCEEKWSDAGAVPPEIYQQYLPLPAGSERLRELAARTAGPDPSPCRQARRLLEHLERNYVYDLDTPSDQAEDPLADFLFVSRRGYCQHFATALAVLLRARGVPARVAVGYLTSDFNPIENYYRVTEADAHAWVEMYLPAGEWITLDPTPAQARGQRRSIIVSWLDSIYDSVKFRWDRYFVDLSLQDQVRIARTIRDRGLIAGEDFIRLPRLAGPGLGLLARRPLLAAGIAAAALYYFLRRKRLAHSSTASYPPRAGRVISEYRRLLKLLARRGLGRRPRETPLELAGRLAGGFAPEFRRATSAYLRVRFGREPVEDEALDAIRAAIMAMKN